MTEFPSEKSQIDANAAPAADAETTDTNTPATKPSWRKRAAIVAAIAVPALVASGAGVAHAHKSVALDVDGQVEQVSTFAGSVQGVLAKQGVTLGEHDVVSPDPNAALTEGATIVVRTAKPIEVMIDGAKHTIWTTADDTAGALAELAASGRSASIVAASRSTERQELSLPLITDGKVKLIVAGEEREIDVEGETTLEGLLLKAEVKLGEHDDVKITPADNNTVIVTIDRVELGERTETEDLPFATTEQKSGDLFVGESKVITAGKAGVITRIYETVSVNGKETSAKLKDEQRTEPTAKVVAIGTKKRPAPKPAPAKAAPAKRSTAASSGGSSSASSTGGAAPTSGVWARLAQCESGGNPRAVSASGTYHGLYQFSVATWRSVGGSGLPSQASPAEQTKRAQILQQRAGWGQWPACSAKLGLR